MLKNVITQSRNRVPAYHKKRAQLKHLKYALLRAIGHIERFVKSQPNRSASIHTLKRVIGHIERFVKSQPNRSASIHTLKRVIGHIECFVKIEPTIFAVNIGSGFHERLYRSKVPENGHFRAKNLG